jgi:hypothetical protein
MILATLLALVAQVPLWATPDALRAAPQSGPAYEAVVRDAGSLAPSCDVANQDSRQDTNAMAAAMLAVATNDAALAVRVEDFLLASIGREAGGRTLALARNLQGLVIAADTIRHGFGWSTPEREAQFVAWVRAVRTVELDGRTLVSTHEDRPNNWGTHAGAARALASAYVGDWQDLRAAARVYAGWLGHREVYAGFDYGDLDWQSDPANPVGVNPRGALIQGHDVDGVLPDDQRRGGGFEWPPPCESYVDEALQGVTVQALVFEKVSGTRVYWNLGSRALLRAVRQRYRHGCEPEGDDRWMVPILDRVLETSYVTGKTEVNTITAHASAPGTGNFTIDVWAPTGTPVTTANIAADATAATVQAALEALSNVASGDVTVACTEANLGVAGAVMTITWESGGSGAWRRKSINVRANMGGMSGNAHVFATPTEGCTAAPAPTKPGKLAGYGDWFVTSADWLL